MSLAKPCFHWRWLPCEGEYSVIGASRNVSDGLGTRLEYTQLVHIYGTLIASFPVPRPAFHRWKQAAKWLILIPRSAEIFLGPRFQLKNSSRRLASHYIMHAITLDGCGGCFELGASP